VKDALARASTACHKLLPYLHAVMGSELCKREGELFQCQSQEFGQGTLKGRSLPGSSVVGETELVTTKADSGEPDPIAFEPIFLGVDDQVVAAPDDFQMGEPTLTKHAGNLGSVGFVVNLSVDGMLPPGLPRHDQATAVPPFDRLQGRRL